MQNKEITSIQNPIIKKVMQLQKKKAVRKKEGLFIVEGIRAIKEIPENYPIEYYITTMGYPMEQLPSRQDTKWIVVPDAIYTHISETTTPQGIMAVVKMPEHSLARVEISDPCFYLVLENLQDPGNLGTIIRTAHAFNVDGIFVTKGSVDAYSPKVIRSTMGSIFHVPVITDIEAEDIVSYLKQHKIQIYTTCLQDAIPLKNISFQKPMALVIGNEGNGVSDLMKQMADYKMIIPMPGGSESLNASIAASICIYEMTK